MSDVEELLVGAFVEFGVSEERELFDELAGSDWLEPDDEVGSGDDCWAVEEVRSAEVP